MQKCPPGGLAPPSATTHLSHTLLVLCFLPLISFHFLSCFQLSNGFHNWHAPSPLPGFLFSFSISVSKYGGFLNYALLILEVFEQATTNISGLKFLSFINPGRNSLSFRPPRFRISSSAKPDTVGKVCEIVRKQLAVSDDKPLTGESKLSELGADSLDTVEIVMGLEEEFGITVEEDNAQNITTVQDAADLINELCSNKAT
ncbi:hypothetical protein HRI_002552500 [Hibiscus trionum]|uniref:Acyl carrier protein n=1 Tax=Hibiscus trionum TaxID=183268 RepID=A0A9W7M3X8_HIBTR|nr:hypothetical protein HRI_002552500 [Hibiscus trionum]